MFVMQQEFFPKLVEVFRVCEDLENMDGLHMVFKIMKGISQYPYFMSFWFPTFYWQFILVTILTYFCSDAVLLNSTQIFERMFSDEFIMDIIGALECKFMTWFFFLSIICHFPLYLNPKNDFFFFFPFFLETLLFLLFQIIQRFLMLNIIVSS